MAQTESIEFPISKATDKATFASIENVCRSVGYQLAGGEVHFSFGGSQSIKTGTRDGQLQAILDLDTIATKRVEFQLNTGTKIVLQRAVKDQRGSVELHDTLRIAPSEGGIEALAYATLIKACRDHFPVIDNRALLDYMRDEDKHHYVEREKAITRLEQMQETFFSKFQDFALAQATANQQRQDEQEAKYAKRLDELNTQHQATLDDLVKREGELEARKKQIDDRDSRHARRQLQTDIQRKLMERSTSFELTEGAQRRRWPVIAGYIALMLFFGAGTWYFLTLDLSSANSLQSTVVIIRQAVFTIAFGVVGGLFVRWNNNWFQSHADEEFRLKRNDLDILRASWVVEIALEWKEQKGTDIPQFLIERLSRNLFIEDKKDQQPLTPAEVLASAVFGSATTTKVKLGDTELSFDRKGMNRRIDTSADGSE